MKSYFYDQMNRYLFTSKRLGFRNWNIDDISAMAAINANPEVMKYFPSIHDKARTSAFIMRMQKQSQELGYCYWAVEELDKRILVGFIGLSYQDYETRWSPFIDIGWRLGEKYWGQGYASEGAKSALEYGFSALSLKKIYAVAPAINIRSINVMKKIGMIKEGEFQHPLLHDYPDLERCTTYSIQKEV